jgi:hypothetical protein
MGIFQTAKVKRLPTMEDIQYSLQTLGNGVRYTITKKDGVGYEVKHWCGIFAVACAVDAGFKVMWDLSVGKPAGAGVKFHWGTSGIQPGDIAVIKRQEHHFIIWSVMGDEIETIDGNSLGQQIAWTVKPLKAPEPDLRIYGYYRLSS